MKRTNILIIVVCILVVGLMVILFFMRQPDNTFNWRENYIQNSNQPFGTEIVTELLDEYFGERPVDIVRSDINSKLLESGEEHTTYFFIGQKAFYTDSTIAVLADFVSRGNDAFLSMQQIPENFSYSILKQSTYVSADSTLYINENGDSIYYEEDMYMEDPNALKTFSSTKITMNFVEEDFKRDSAFNFNLIIRDEPALYNWLYFLPEYQKSIVNYTALGSLYSENFINFIKVPHGKGNFYIHTNPIVFSNYFQIDKNNLEYTSKVFSYLRSGDIIWDEFSKTYTPDFNQNNDQQEEGPLKYILSQTPLRWAWYCILGSLLLFIVFRTRRSQQSIRVMEPNENKSLEFVQTIGRMYYIRKNHKQLSHQKMKLFFHFINERYQINSQIHNDEFINRLQLKSEIGKDVIVKIFKHYTYINNTDDVTDDDLIQLHSLLDQFYKNCK